MAVDEVLNIGIDVDIKSATKQMAKFQKTVLKQMQAVTKAIESVGKSNNQVTDAAVKGTEDWKDATDKLGTSVGGLEKRLGKPLLGDPKAFGKAFGKEMEEAGEKFVGKVESFLTKDAKTLVDNLGGLLKKGLMKGGAGIGGAGAKLKGAGAGMRERGEGMGGLKGAGLKGLGKAVGGMGKILSVVSKMAPLLSIAATAIMGIVKMFIDAEAQAKEFQKGILESASTAEFLRDNFGEVDMAAADLKETLKGVRDAAFDASGNLDWGITHETHKAVLNTLNQEGVSLNRLSKEAGKGAEAMKKYSAEIVHVNVAYARTFGVSLQEVGQFQAEMMTELGMSLDQTKLSFTQMTRSAVQSGISSNKFFSMIRGVSQDLSLYNMRLDEAAKVLGKIGKAMSPRNAQKFLSTMSGFMKGMDLDSRMRMSLLGGGTGLKKDVGKREENLIGDLKAAGAGTAEEIKKALADPALTGEMFRNLAKSSPEKVGALRESHTRLKEAKGAMGKGVYGQAVAMRHMTMAGSYDSARKSLGKFGGGGSIVESRGGLAFEKMAQNLQMDEDMLEGLASFEIALNEQKALLKKQADMSVEQKAALVEGINNDKDLSAEEKSDRIKQLELTKEQIDAMDTYEVLDSMTEEQKKMVENEEVVVDHAKSQTDLQTSLLDKISILVDFLMNQFYNLMMDIWDIIASAPIFGKDKSEVDAKRAVFESKDPAMMKAFEDSTKGGEFDAHGFKGRMATGATGKRMSSILGGGGERAEGVKAAIKEQLGTGKDILGMAGMAGVGDDKMAALRAQLTTTTTSPGTYNAKMDKMVGGGTTSSLAASADPEAAMTAAGFSSTEIADVLGKAIWQAGGDASKVAAIGGAVSATPLSKEEVAFQESQTKLAEDTKAEQQRTADGVEKGTKDGSFYVKYSTGYHRKYMKDMGSELLQALRQALFEYYMYSALDQDEVAEAMAEKGLNAEDFAKEIYDRAQKGEMVGAFLDLEATGDDDDDEEGEGKKGKKKRKKKRRRRSAPGSGGDFEMATGGKAMSVADGFADMARAHGEGLTPIGPGEIIVPKGGSLINGGGGGKTTVVVKLDGAARQMFRAEIINTVHEMQRAGKLS